MPNASAGAQPARLALHHYFDLQPLCAQHPLVAARTFERDRQLRAMWERAVVVQPRRGRAFPGGWRLHTEDAVREAFAHAEGARLLVLRGLWRSVTNDEIADEQPRVDWGGEAVGTPALRCVCAPRGGRLFPRFLSLSLADAPTLGGGGGHRS